MVHFRLAKGSGLTVVTYGNSSLRHRAPGERAPVTSSWATGHLSPLAHRPESHWASERIVAVTA
jgi:hypothetical protein